MSRHVVFWRHVHDERGLRSGLSLHWEPLRMSSERYLVNLSIVSEQLESISVELSSLNKKFERFLRIEEEKYPPRMPLHIKGNDLLCTACFSMVSQGSRAVENWRLCTHGDRCPACGPCEECSEGEETITESLGDA